MVLSTLQICYKYVDINLKRSKQSLVNVWWMAHYLSWLFRYNQSFKASTHIKSQYHNLDIVKTSSSKYLLVAWELYSYRVSQVFDVLK